MPHSIKVLIVDDEPDILDFLKYNLENEGYTVSTALTGKSALEIAESEHPHLILLDVMMPGMDGIETCRLIRSNSKLNDTLIVFLSARNEEYSQISAYDAGADDYISKPIRPRLLVKKLKALLKRQENLGDHDILKFDDIEIDTGEYLVRMGKNNLTLPRKEFELLYMLASNPGKVFKRQKILRKIWGQEVIVGDRTIDVHIRRLREKLGDDIIKTIKGIGYKFNK